MPERFLKALVAAHVKDGPQSDRTQVVLELAAKCIADTAVGIFADDLERAAGGSPDARWKRFSNCRL